MEIGDRMALARAKKNMSQRKVASLLGIPTTTYAGYEQNRRRPDPAILAKIARILDTSVDFLLGVQEEANNLYLKLAHAAEEAQLTEEEVEALLHVIKVMKK
ncbi:MAG: helix-turn-helix domain-containing protein [Thermacetogeniaceae bacterium]